MKVWVTFAQVSSSPESLTQTTLQLFHSSDPMPPFSSVFMCFSLTHWFCLLIFSAPQDSGPGMIYLSTCDETQTTEHIKDFIHWVKMFLCFKRCLEIRDETSSIHNKHIHSSISGLFCSILRYQRFVFCFFWCTVGGRPLKSTFQSIVFCSWKDEFIHPN